jgi:hypothetical protein
LSPWRGESPGPVAGRAFWGRFLLYWLASSGLGTLLLFLFFYRLLSVPLTGGYGAVFHALRRLGDGLLPVVLLSVLVYILLVGVAAAFFCIRVLHKIAGPIFRLERTMGEFLDGEPVKPFFLRHGDLVPELASAFNGFVGRLREDRQRWEVVMENADRLCLLDRETCRAAMEKALADLETLLARYR